MTFGIGSSVFGTYEKDLGRVINPYQNDEQSASCSITRCDTAASDIKSDQGLSYREQHGSNDGSYRNISPNDRFVG
jgi:hypothetical protein